MRFSWIIVDICSIRVTWSELNSFTAYIVYAFLHPSPSLSLVWQWKTRYTLPVAPSPISFGLRKSAQEENFFLGDVWSGSTSTLTCCLSKVHLLSVFSSFKGRIVSCADCASIVDLDAASGRYISGGGSRTSGEFVGDIYIICKFLALFI